MDVYVRRHSRRQAVLLRGSLGENVEEARWEEIPVEPVPTNYERFVEAVRSGRNNEPSFRHAARLQKVLDLAIISDEKRASLSVG